MSVTSNSRAGSPDDFTLVSFNEVLSIENENSRKAQKAIEKLMSKQNRTILNFEKKTGEHFDRRTIPEDQHYDTKFSIHFITKKIDLSSKTPSPCSIIERESSPFNPIDEEVNPTLHLPRSDQKHSWFELQEIKK